MIALFLLGLALAGYAQAQTCGQKPDQPPWNPRIVGGRNATEGYWPWQLSLQIWSTTTNAFRHTCGAALVEPGFALTAAHCVHDRGGPADFRLVAGLYEQDNLDGAQILPIDAIVEHDRFEMDPTIGFPNDIAVLRLVTPADLSDPNVDVACMTNETDMNIDNAECWMTGWGKTHFTEDGIPNTLQEGWAVITPNQVCDDEHFGYIRDTHICAGDGLPVSACSGDSGGPLNCKVGDNWYVAGLTSWGIVTCQDLPSIYVRVSKFWEWTKVVMDDLRPVVPKKKYSKNDVRSKLVEKMMEK